VRLLHTPLPQVTDASLLGLIEELALACNVQPEAHYTLYKFAWQCVYPGGAGDKRYPIEKNRLNPVGLLSAKVRKHQGTLIYQFCHELAMMTHNEGAELVEGMALYVFLNRYLPDVRKKTKPKPFDPRDRR
jgi:hypothetical protein